MSNAEMVGPHRSEIFIANNIHTQVFVTWR